MTRRRIAECADCGETREMATKTLCFTCYRRYERKEEREKEQKPVDRHTPAIRREHTRLLKGYTGLINACRDMSIAAQDVQKILDIVAPYLEPVRPLLTLKSEKGESNA